MLFDTGMSRTNHDSAEVERIYRGDAPLAAPWHLHPVPAVNRCTWGLPGDPLVAALEPLGLQPSDLSLAVLSHFHWDHSGGIGTLAAAGVPVVVYAEELSFVRSSRAEVAAGFGARDWTAPGTRWQSVDTETQVDPA